MKESPGYILDAISAQAFARLESEAHEAATSPWNTRKHPTPAQFRAANWKHGQFELRPGMRLKIENARGTIRHGKSEDGTPWENRMAAHYGDIIGTLGADGDPVDIFLGPFPECSHLWVINQRGPNGFDEHKVMAGFHTEDAARAAYFGSYDRGWDGLESIVPCTYAQLRWWLRNGDTSAPFTTDNIPQQGTAIMDKAVLWDADANPVGLNLHELVYAMRREDAGDSLMLDAATMADLMTDPDIEATVTLDALVVEVSRMSRKMDLLKTVMDAAGDTVKPEEVTISDPVRARGVLQVMVLFQMSDGQTVSIWFHNPDTTPAKLTPLDELVSWKWMLNKKDVTIWVAPERGRELNIREVARRIMRLVQRNSDAFKRSNTKAAERVKKVEDLKSEIAVLEVDLSDWQRKIEREQLVRDEAPTPKEKWDSARGHASAVVRTLKDDLMEASLTARSPAASDKYNLALNSLALANQYATGEKATASPEELRSTIDNLAVDVRSLMIEAAKEPAPVAAAPAPTPAPAPSASASDGALSGLGVRPDDLAAMSADGGYAAILADEKLSLKWQDVLDSALQQRIVDVRNALRVIGWVGKGAELQRTFSGSVHGIKADTKNVGAGANVVGITWNIDGGTITVPDSLLLSAAEMASYLDLQLASTPGEASPEPAPAFTMPELPDPVGLDLSTTDYEAAKAIQAQAEEQQKRYADPLQGAPKGAMGMTSDEVKATPEWQRVYRQQQAAFEELRRVNAWFAENFSEQRRTERDAQRAAVMGTLPAGFTQGPGTIATNPDPITGGIIDAQIASGKWFVIFNNDAIPKSEAEYDTRAEAIDAFNAAMADLEAAAAPPKSPTDSELQAAAEAGAEVNRISRNLADLKGTEGLPKATLSGGKAETIFLYTDADVARAVKAVHDAEEQTHFRPFDLKSLKMPTAVQLGLNKSNTLILPVSDTDQSMVLDGWSNGHLMDFTQRPPLVEKAVAKYFVDNSSAFIRKLPQAKIEKVEVEAKSRTILMEPVAHYDYEQTVVDNTKIKKAGDRYEKIPVNSVVFEAADGSDAWVWLDSKYVAYFVKTYKGCQFFSHGPTASVAVRQHGKLVGVIMPMNAKGDSSIIARAKRVKAASLVAQDPDALTPNVVDAAYKFENATEAFKVAVAHSVAESDYSAFRTARTVDERAKALGLSVSWDVQSVVLDSAALPGFDAHSVVSSLQAGRERVLDDLIVRAAGYLPAGAVLDFVGNTAHAVVQLQAALDSVTASEPTNRAAGKIEQADLERASAEHFRHAIYALTSAEVLDGVKADPLMVRITSGGKAIGTMTPAEFMKAAKAPHGTFLPAAIKKFNEWKESIGEPERAEQFLVGGKKVLDDAGDAGEGFETCVGTITRNGEVIGRVVVMDGDGKAMIYLGASGTQRVTYVSKVDGERRPAMWSDDDAGEMVDWLVENIAQAEAAAAAPAAPAEEAVDPAVQDARDRAAAGHVSIQMGLAAIDEISNFMPVFQRKFIASAMRGEEGQYFADKMWEMRELIHGMPKVYEQDGKGGAAVVYLHYFKGNADWWITERDFDLGEQAQAYGMVDLGHGPEMGYISIDEVAAAGAELDLHWDQKTIGELRGEEPETAGGEEDLNIGRRWRSASGTMEVTGFKDGRYTTIVEDPSTSETAPGLPVDPDELEQTIRDDEREATEAEAEARAAQAEADKIDVPELIAAGFTRVGGTGQQYAKDVDNGENAVRHFNVKRVGGNGYPQGWKVSYWFTFKNGITGAPAQDLGRFATVGAALAAVEERMPPAAPAGENAPMNELRPLSPQTPDRAEWEGAIAREMTEKLDVSNGDAQGMMEARPDDLDVAYARGDAPAAVVAALWPVEQTQVDPAPVRGAPDRAAWESQVIAVMQADDKFDLGKKRPVEVMQAKLSEQAALVDTLFAKGASAEDAAVTIMRAGVGLGTPASDPAKDADRAYLQTLADGSADYLDAGILERLEPMFEKYASDADMMALVEKAANAYSDAATALAKQALGT